MTREECVDLVQEILTETGVSARAMEALKNDSSNAATLTQMVVSNNKYLRELGRFEGLIKASEIIQFWHAAQNAKKSDALRNGESE